jgi:hypothetical protein
MDYDSIADLKILYGLLTNLRFAATVVCVAEGAMVGEMCPGFGQHIRRWKERIPLVPGADRQALQRNS